LPDFDLGSPARDSITANNAVAKANTTSALLIFRDELPARIVHLPSRSRFSGAAGLVVPN
jgi:hypothetical protein